MRATVAQQSAAYSQEAGVFYTCVHTLYTHHNINISNLMCPSSVRASVARGRAVFFCFAGCGFGWFLVGRIGLRFVGGGEWAREREVSIKRNHVGNFIAL